ncbi:MAG: ABC transporter permease subunit, partial [Actinomycetota bacterium]
MELLLQQIVTGLGSGAVYASLALALVFIFRSTNLVNFAQGEMAMFSTYFAWQLTRWGIPVWGALLITLAVS